MRPGAAMLLLLVLPVATLGWGGEGHQLVALIAEDQLTPAARAAVKELLESGSISDAAVANWADEIRRERRETSGWHYVNIPHDAQGFDRERDGRNGDNVIDAIEREAKILADKAAPRERRVEALKFIVHFVADLHQPLHCVDRNGDKGGNTRLVFFLDRRKADSLHYVWDTGLAREMIGKRPIAPVAQAMSRSISAKQRKEWAARTPEQWANEAHGVAVEK